MRWQLTSYHPGKVVNIGARMPGIWLIVQDAKGQYSSSAHILLYEGQMLAYDPASNLTEWVPMWGKSLSLTSTELKSANDLSNIFPCPDPIAKPLRIQLPRPIHGLLVGEETGTETDITDLEEWDELEHDDWSTAPPLHWKGPWCGTKW